MNKISIREIVADKVNDIWKKYKGKPFTSIPPLSIEEILDAPLIFIGLNPSISNKDKELFAKKPIDTIDFYPLHSEIEAVHPYFRKFFKVAEQTNLEWTHFDLLFLRETKQSKVSELFKVDEGLNFILDQLSVSKSILDKLLLGNKRIFVINNTMSRGFLGMDRPENYTEDQPHWMDYRFEWNEELGTYFYNGHAFFFSSMLTGQRALDNGSFERLVWHIRKVKTSMNL